VRSLVDEDLIAAHRKRALNPNRPVLRGSAQNPDVFFQAREAVNPYYAAVPGIVASVMERVGQVTGRPHHLFEYHGSPDAERVVVLMGSGVGATREAVDHLAASGEKVGMVVVKLYRPFDTEAFAAVLPKSAKRLMVMDRTKEPGAPGEPLYLDVVASLAEQGRNVEVYGCRYGLSSKEFTPAMVGGVFAELAAESPRRHTTVGIIDDVTRLSVSYDPDWLPEPEHVTRALFYGLGSDGTVSANQSTARIIGETTGQEVQGYFVYDSKKAGARTVSHLRMSPEPIDSTYLVAEASFVGVHHFHLLDETDALDRAAPGSTVLINSPYERESTWERIPSRAQAQIVEKGLRVWAVDAQTIAKEAGLGTRINTVLQACFFALTDLLPFDRALEEMRRQIEATYGKRGETVIARNVAAIEEARAGLYEVPHGDMTGTGRDRTVVPEVAPEFVQRVTARIMAGEGDLLPVSAMPVDGTFPTGTTQWEKRSLATEIPIWDPSLCIDCGRCALACPHAAIRIKVFDADMEVPEGFLSKAPIGKDFEGKRLVVQVAPDDCTGCTVCVDICPAKSKEVAKYKAINMRPKADHLERERRNYSFFLDIPESDKSEVNAATVKGSQVLQPLFEYSSACVGCGETPYLKLMTQLVGDRVIVANSTGCSSIYGGNLPTTPWSANPEGRGPAWSNSLFEDNAEFGLGMRLALESQRADALLLVTALFPDLGELAARILALTDDTDRSDLDGRVAEQRRLVDELKTRLSGMEGPLARRLEGVADALIDTSVWIVGGDGWAYDIGFGGLDHVFASGRNVNILVLDTEVYSNTGGQASKATSRGAIAKFAAGGKTTGKKDLGQIAMSYGNVYVAQVALGANPNQAVRAFAEAEHHDGVSLIIAYSPCIAHGYDLTNQIEHQRLAGDSGYWPLYRYDPAREAEGQPGLRLDSRKPKIPFRRLAESEARFSMLGRISPETAGDLMSRAQQDIDDRWNLYEQMVHIHRTAEYTEMDE
jgi:pyruvate-ferredoxin/flavodoxin oxidoreductase